MLGWFFTLGAARIKYGIMVDAGSSGTRAFVYTWESTLDIPDVHPVTSKGKEAYIKLKDKPLAAAAKNPNEIASIFEQIIDYCKPYIPTEQISNTRMFVYATAGMRLLSTKEQDAVLEGVYEYLLKNSPFKLKRRYIRIISGIEEGVFGWLSVNHLLGNFEKNIPTIGALDMGGASFQIAVEVGDDVRSNSIHNVTVGKKHLTLFAHSYLGYGVNQALLKVSRAISSVLETNEIENPCIHKGLQLTLDGVTNKGTGNFSKCSSLIRSLMTLSPEFSSIQVPNIHKVKKFIAMASFYYANHYLGLQVGSTLEELKNAATAFCGEDYAEAIKRHPADQYSTSFCWFATYQYNMLYEGYGFRDGDVIVEKREYIDGKDLSWTTGAMLSEVAEIEIDDAETTNVSLKQVILVALSVVLVCVIAVAFFGSSNRSVFQRMKYNLQ